jgi:methyl-accepting chemotaxis protein
MNLDLEALETSFDLVAPHGDELMDAFYARLFAAAPAVEPLFAGTDLKRQKTMLLGTLVLLRKSLRDFDAIVPKLRELGARHVGYGARPEHYPVVGEAPIAAMAELAGPAWIASYERAWGDAFAAVTEAMLEGAASLDREAAAGQFGLDHKPEPAHRPAVAPARRPDRRRHERMHPVRPGRPTSRVRRRKLADTTFRSGTKEHPSSGSSERQTNLS